LPVIRASGVALLLAFAALIASSVLWMTSGAPPTIVPNGAALEPSRVLGELERTSFKTVDLGARYSGRLELLDPPRTLPTWHTHPRPQAAAVFTATRDCPPPPLALEVSDPALAKAYAWHAKTCSPTAPIPEEMVERPPFMHPSGKSYAALAVARGGSPASSFVADHVRSFHVAELPALGPSALDDATRELQLLTSREWTAVARGDRIVLTPKALVLVDHDALGLRHLRIFERRAWDAIAKAASIALAPRVGDCAVPASSTLCWQPVSTMDRRRSLLVAATTSSAGLVIVAAVLLAIASVRERRRVHADRIHVLRTLTHELRTPATSLGFDIEPLRAAYDELPASCQEPLLRVSDGIARLNRVLHRSARYMALFETTSSREGPGGLLNRRPVPSAAELMTELAEEWPEGVRLRAESEDGPLVTDPEWLAVAARNLVENALRHGEPPVVVTWRIDDGAFVLRVADAGTSPALSLRRAIAPHHRDPASKGLGLGLAIVDRVARLLEGTLAHEDAPTVFELRLPNPPEAKA
jgi:signal transduction histidine kinase